LKTIIAKILKKFQYFNTFIRIKPRKIPQHKHLLLPCKCGGKHTALAQERLSKIIWNL